MPKVGSELCNPEDPEIVQVTDLQKLLEVLGIHDVIPVGSKGILKEAQLLASNNNSKLLINQSCSLDLNKSAGPSTCLVFSASSSTKENLLSLNRDQLQLNKIGALI